MLTFKVADMTCGHCVNAITKAVQSVDPGATVRAEVAVHHVHIEPIEADTPRLRDAITEAGYTPVLVHPDAVPAALAGAPRRGGCCCG